MNFQKIKVVLEYDGTEFAGWQVQPEERTIQDELEKAIERITGKKCRVTGAGRTDAGVHAMAQVAHFSTEANLNPSQWVGALNGNLPRDVRVLDAVSVDENFDARRSARGKLYRYTISTRRAAPALDRFRVWHAPYRLDVEAMRESAKFLVGEHDFSSFKGAKCASRNQVRTIGKLEIEQAEPEKIVIDIEATAFLKQMVRNIVGTLFDVGRGRTAPNDMKEILEIRDRKKAGATAPARGLTLVAVYYE